MTVTVKATIGASQGGLHNENMHYEHLEQNVDAQEGKHATSHFSDNNAPFIEPVAKEEPVISTTPSSNTHYKRSNILDVTPKLTVIGVGGAGGNAVNNMIKYHLQGVKFVAANTDAQALRYNNAENKIQLGHSTTLGLGAGSRPNVGKLAAEESLAEIMAAIGDANMLFITAGMGGGTGTGAAPVIAEAARKQGILTVGVVTKPFQFEGAHRMRMALEGINELQNYVDTLIIIPNQNLFRIANAKTTFADAFKMADDVLYSGVRSVTDLMIIPGLINLDFADIKSVMTEMGKAMMGTGEATGDNRAILAAEAAIANPLLDDVSMKGAKGVLISVTGGMDMTLFDVDAAANRIREEVETETANIIFGSTFDESMEGVVRVSVVATGIDHELTEQYGVANAFHISADNIQLSELVEAEAQFEQFSHEEESVLLSDSGTATQQEELLQQMPEDCEEVSIKAQHKNRNQPQKRSFFSRLFGKREVDYDGSSEPRVRPSADDADSIVMGTSDTSDVPAYIRRQNN